MVVGVHCGFTVDDCLVICLLCSITLVCLSFMSSHLVSVFVNLGLSCFISSDPLRVLGYFGLSIGISMICHLLTLFDNLGLSVYISSHPFRQFGRLGPSISLSAYSFTALNLIVILLMLSITQVCPSMYLCFIFVLSVYWALLAWSVKLAIVSFIKCHSFGG